MALPTNSTSMPKVLWRHPNPQRTNLYKFKQMLEAKDNVSLPTFHALYTHSIAHPFSFWSHAFRSFPIVYSGHPTPAILSSPNETPRMDSLPKWFPNTNLNYAENVLYTPSPTSPSQRTTLHKEDTRIVLVEVREGGSAREITWGYLRARTAIFASALHAHGVQRGDRVAVVAGNGLDTLCVFLGVTTLGGLFSSSSCDMGVSGILERLRQIEPKWVFVDDEAVYNGGDMDMREKMKEIVKGMKGVGGFEGIVSVPRVDGRGRDVGDLEGVIALDSFLKRGRGLRLPEFERVGFNEGFLIVYSSGTTGPPKCIVHGVGGVVLSAWKEGALHREMGRKTVAMQYTTTGWIMYLASIQSLLLGGKLIMYDGSPFYPRVDSFLQLVGRYKVTHLGISPRYLQTLQTASVIPHKAAELSSLEVVTSTGMVLPRSVLAYFYSSNGFPSRAHLANISGGTDIAGAFADCNALDPVYETGGCQGRSLGIDVRVYDPDVEEGGVGKEMEVGEEGELVAIKAFPNMPIKFWADVHNQKYLSAYFKRFDNVWTHGDFISLHPPTLALLLHGRADGVLNPSGIRFGSAEIYNIIDTFFGGEVEDSVCVGQRRVGDTDERVLLFLKLRPSSPSRSPYLPAPLVSSIKSTIAQKLSRRHVPAYIFETPEIPMTINGKKVETPLKAIVSGKGKGNGKGEGKIKVSGTLANPQCLKWYERFFDVEGVVARGESKL